MAATRSERNQWKNKRKRRRAYFLWFVVLVIGFAGVSLVAWKYYNRLVFQKEADNLANGPELIRQVKANQFTDKAIDEYLRKTGFVGSVYIEDQGDFVLEKSYGDADFETGRVNDLTSSFYIASAQKAIVGTALLQLVDRGLIRLNDPIDKYISGFPNGKKITINNFLGHTTGLKPRREGKKPITPEGILWMMKEAGIKSAPGKWNYADDNYTVIGYLVQMISGMPLYDYMERNIFIPAGMTGAGFYPTFDANRTKTNSYLRTKNGMVSVPLKQDFSQLFGAGDMYMTAKDLMKFDEALLSGKLVSETSLKRMFRKGPGKYGVGFYDLNSYYISRGVLGGYEASNAFTKDHKKTIILLSNARTKAKSHYQYTKDILDIMNKN
ncbi:serine hydrolase domain-containing protein [Listeria floridensis]|uniref:serine hydrolase domain-containing protein n=1 Tax=Listeria floridensis TaxID=1494962 RepID=UPI00138AD940|nr:serine hydrolase domain-containing protein [Listeria floridensis]